MYDYKVLGPLGVTTRNEANGKNVEHETEPEVQQWFTGL